MKTLKPIMFVVAGMAIAFLVSFKNEEPVKEYASITAEDYGSKLQTITIVKEGASPEYIELKNSNATVELIKYANKMSQDKWRVISSDFYGAAAPNKRIFYLERTKP